MFISYVCTSGTYIQKCITVQQGGMEGVVLEPIEKLRGPMCGTNSESQISQKVQQVRAIGTPSPKYISFYILSSDILQ